VVVVVVVLFWSSWSPARMSLRDDEDEERKCGHSDGIGRVAQCSSSLVGSVGTSQKSLYLDVPIDPIGEWLTIFTLSSYMQSLTGLHAI